MRTRTSRSVLVRFAGCLTAALLAIPHARAMTISTLGDQLILAGPVTGTELPQITIVLDENPAITTVILRNSPGGDAVTGYRAGELFRARGLRPAVSGFCFSSCSRMFLGGKVRVFTDDLPPENTNVGFHGHYDRYGRLNAESVQKLGLKDWIIKYSDGHADPALVERWINIPVGRGMMHFYHPTRLHGFGATTFFCRGNEPAHTDFICEREARSALDLGITTALDVITSNDVAAQRGKPQ